MAHFDVLIRHGTLVDGTGAARQRGDVGIRGDHIAALGELHQATADTVIDATGRIVAPGFIDSHTHDDRYLTSAPQMPAKLSQGVTTVVTGNCGISLAPWTARAGQGVPQPLNLLSDDPADFRFPTFAGYLADLESRPAAINAACLVGHTALRAAAMESLDRSADAAEIAHMQELLREAMEAGAIGLSTGAAYPAAMPASTAEMEGVISAMRGYGGVYASHIRDESDRIFEAMDEAIAVGAAGAANTVLSHHKLIGKHNHGRSVQTLAHVAQARLSHPVALDAYPYTAGSTVLRKDRLPVSSRVIVTKSVPHPEHAGRDLDDIARDMGLSPEDAVDALQPAGAIYFLMDEQDVQRILKFPATMVGSDGIPHDSAPHPRLWGTFPRVLGHYCRDVGLFTLEEAVHKMTGLTATHFKLPGRGVLAVGNFADVTVFDAGGIADLATWEAPTRQAAGIDAVLVNGALAWRDGAATGVFKGRVIRHSDGGAPS
ncbi:amidohydrolase family protein [Xylophilus rhododendri]|uniref:Amidohydrolase family protein n=1 Tax=Xylophilus rhododendri TaxID=2697032 RepID=A0A857J5N6_9BURK|nr:D-aminoacylase [Xylophilus rhododendri]QHI99017.1 amidohydrolase family protein [Xylophilus rhododendri]